METLKIKHLDLPFPTINIRSIAKKSLISNLDNSKIPRGITSKSSNLLSIATSILIQNFLKEVKKIINSQNNNTINRSHLIETCIKIPKYRFMIHLLKLSEIQFFFGPQNELSKRIVLHTINRQQPLAVPFIAPNPPGRIGQSEEDPIIREAENSEEIFHVLAKSNTAYLMKVPSFIIPKHLEK